MTTYAYVRVSSGGLDCDPQKPAIYDYCERNKLSIDEWKEITISSRKTIKQQLIEELLNEVQKGDLLIVAELSRLGRSVGQVISIVNEIVEKKVDFIAIKENIKITSENGNKMDIAAKTMVMMFSLFAKIERDLISQRTKEGLAAAKKKGKQLGRPPGGSILEGKENFIRTELGYKVSVSAIARKLEVDRMTVKRFIKSKKLRPWGKRPE